MLCLSPNDIVIPTFLLESMDQWSNTANKQKSPMFHGRNPDTNYLLMKPFEWVESGPGGDMSLKQFLKGSLGC